MRIGIGYDSHRLVEGRPLIIGGVEIPFGKGLHGHSDADVLCHAIIDALIGALGKGDIGKHFPDTDEKWKGASGIELLSQTVRMLQDEGFEISWIDSTVILQEPKIGGFIEAMKNEMSKAGIPVGSVNIKAKTDEGMGFIGRGEGAAAQAVCLLKRA
ncbi:MAG: 2-C-methyl-D-erythritol 2,4-cyclodiphosphate synthase [Nitrospirae bacterium]|nr:2-C-methyl-D-erythritol 2,4-cyclodiphosphate synthase [Nitrospirota bacterium]